jgi:Tfp pilus assembly protein PilF
MKAPLLLTASLLLVLPPAWAADLPGGNPSLPAPTVQNRLDTARKSVGSRDWSAAMRELNLAVRESPQNADVHNLMGYTYRKRANPDMTKAYEHYQMALKINPQHRGAHEYIGEAYLQDRRLPDAERHLVELERICGGPACEEYRDLAKSIADYKAKN